MEIIIVSSVQSTFSYRLWANIDSELTVCDLQPVSCPVYSILQQHTKLQITKSDLQNSYSYCHIVAFHLQLM